MADLTGRIELYSGGFLDFRDPDPSTITRNDVARGLSQICRYTGQSTKFYSVAEHAVLVSKRLEQLGYGPKIQWEGLHHDNAEAFVGDVNRPLKDLLPEFKAIELRVWCAINDALDLGINPPQHPAVKQADDWALSMEAFHLLPSKGRNWFSWGLYSPAQRPIPPAIVGTSPTFAWARWLTRYDQLREVLNAESEG